MENATLNILKESPQERGRKPYINSYHFFHFVFIERKSPRKGTKTTQCNDFIRRFLVDD